MKLKYPKEKITELINTLYQEDWFNYFNRLRNRITHREPLSLTLEIISLNNKPYLPDEPDDFLPKCDKRLDVVGNCRRWLDGSCKFIEEGSNLLGPVLFVEW